MKSRILAVDSHIVGGNVTNASFYNASSFSDYDVVVIDPVNISDAWGNINFENLPEGINYFRIGHG